MVGTEKGEREKEAKEKKVKCRSGWGEGEVEGEWRREDEVIQMLFFYFFFFFLKYFVDVRQCYKHIMARNRTCQYTLKFVNAMPKENKGEIISRCDSKFSLFTIDYHVRKWLHTSYVSTFHLQIRTLRFDLTFIHLMHKLWIFAGCNRASERSIIFNSGWTNEKNFDQQSLVLNLRGVAGTHHSVWNICTDLWLYVFCSQSDTFNSMPSHFSFCLSIH